MRFILFILLGITSGCIPDLSSQDSSGQDYIHGVVVGITDSDTLALLTPDKEQVKIRLAEIDTPERSQPFGTWAKEQLSGMAFQQEIAVLVVDVDRFDRIIGRAFINDIDVNAELARIGAAWVYDKYATDHHLYELQNEAANASRGLWSQPQPITPGYGESRGRLFPYICCGYYLLTACVRNILQTHFVRKCIFVSYPSDTVCDLAEAKAGRSWERVHLLSSYNSQRCHSCI